MTKRAKLKFYPSAMTIAGSDSGGGAGIAADLRTFNAFGVYGCCAIAAVTSQNPAAVRRIDPLAGEAVAAQIDAVLEKIPVKCAKTGMLFSAEIIRAVAGCVKKHSLHLVCDPVMISTSGKCLLEKDAVAVLKDELLPLAKWITPNIPEAEALAGRKISGIASMRDAAFMLRDKFNCHIWLKGGHLAGRAAEDVIVYGEKAYSITSPLCEVPPLTAHGTGCTLSAALTSMLALDLPWKQAVCESKAFVYGSLVQSVEIGQNLSAMYPPSEDSISLVKLTELEQD